MSSFSNWLLSVIDGIDSPILQGLAIGTLVLVFMEFYYCLFTAIFSFFKR